jgi:carboxypeptidase C (cathepsin A)
VSRFLAGLVLALALLASNAFGASAPSAPSATGQPVVTHHQIHLADGSTLSYTATAGMLLLRDDQGQPTASIFYVAYTTGDPMRPVTFLSNGGPGSASLWLHIGGFGPRRLVTSNATFAPPNPYRLEDNPDTLLTTSDLVFIDPVGTGYSTVVGKGRNSDFWGVDEDLREFSQFIRRWLVVNDRTTSPKFLYGESYGTFRSAGLVERLRRDGTTVDGIVLQSTLLDYADVFGYTGDENLPDAFALPSEAAVAFFHHQVSAPDVATQLQRARTFTTTQLLPALLGASPLADADRSRLAQGMHDLIGLDPGFLLRNDLRISTARFERELLHSDNLVVGHYDGRFAGNPHEHNAGSSDFDPSLEAIAPAFTTAFTGYLQNELGWRATGPYRPLAERVTAQWNFRRAGFAGRVLAPSVVPDLRDAMRANPNLRVFAACGWYDLATPLYVAEYELANVASNSVTLAHISFGYYPSGHMIYLNPDALHGLRADLDRFYAQASPSPRPK